MTIPIAVCLYRVDAPDDEQQACSKHVEAYYSNKLIENSASCWFILYGLLYCVIMFVVAKNKQIIYSSHLI